MEPPPALSCSDDDEYNEPPPALSCSDDDEYNEPPPDLSDEDLNAVVPVDLSSSTESDNDQSELNSKPVDFIKSGSVTNIVGLKMQKVKPRKERQPQVQWRKAQGGPVAAASLRDWGNSILFMSFVIHLKKLSSKQQGTMVEGSVWLHKDGTPVLVCRIIQIGPLAVQCAAFKKLFTGRYVYVCLYICLSVLLLLSVSLGFILLAFWG